MCPGVFHLELGFVNPLKDNWLVSSVLSGIKRGKASPPSYKLPVTVSMLHDMHKCLNHTDPEQCCVWSAILCCFFGLLRLSNVTVKQLSTWDPKKNSGQIWSCVAKVVFSMCLGQRLYSIKSVSYRYHYHVCRVTMCVLHQLCYSM